MRSGRAWGENEAGPYEGRLDLDRLLHHEERHSQQRHADYNHRAAYLGAAAGEAVFGIPNQYEWTPDSPTAVTRKSQALTLSTVRPRTQPSRILDA